MALSSKSALITGGADGLGRAFVEILLENGSNVCIFDINKDGGLAAERTLQMQYPDRVFFFLGDVTSEHKIQAAIEETIDRFGGLDILCNNAGIDNEQDYRKTIEVNMTSVVQNTLLGLRHMGDATGRKGAVIVNVASISGILPQPDAPVYTSTKFAVVGFSRALGAISRKLYNIRVNCLCPTYTDTPMVRRTPEQVQSRMFDERMLKWSKKSHVRIGLMRPREVAECFLRLVTDDTLSGEAMLASPDAKGIMKLSKRLGEAIASCKI